jgi:hypothetical protein
MFALNLTRPVTMSTSRKKAASTADVDLQELREQEVLRANRELAAYFRGRRTEREARAALKIVKAFIRDREHTDPAKRRPLPGAASARQRKTAPKSKASAARRRKRTLKITAPAGATAPGSSTHEDGVGEHRGIAVAFPHD